MNNDNQRKVTNISLNITEDCNFACEYCFVKNHPKKMKLETAKQAIDWLILHNKDNKNAKMHVNFFGGEPTLEWDMLKKLTEYGKSKSDNISFGMTTNGSLLTKERLDYCENNGVGILLSIDGPEYVQNIHRKLRGGGSTFDKVEYAMREVAKRNLSPTARVTYTPSTLPYLFETIKYLFEEIGFRDIAPSPATDSWEPFTEDDIKEYNKQFDLIDSYYKDLIISGKNHSLNYYGKCLRQITADSKLKAPCGAGKGYLGIGTEGGIYPCHRFVGWEEWKIGDVWKGIVDVNKRNVFLNYDCDISNSKCRKCDNMFCGSTCLAGNYVSTGSIFIPGEDSCKLSKLQFERAVKLIDDMKDFKQFRVLYKNYVRKDKSGIFSKYKDEFLPEKNIKGKNSCGNKDEKKYVDLKLINNRINQLESRIKEVDIKVDNMNKMVSSLSNVILDIFEGGKENDKHSYTE